MNTTEYLLTKLTEELIETAQRVSKALCFGLAETQEGQPFTNSERIMQEFEDVLVIMALLRENNLLPDINLPEDIHLAKRKKVLKYMQYSRDCGTLRDFDLDQEHVSAPDSAPMAAHRAVPANTCTIAADRRGADVGQPASDRGTASVPPGVVPFYHGNHHPTHVRERAGVRTQADAEVHRLATSTASAQDGGRTLSPGSTLVATRSEVGETALRDVEIPDDYRGPIIAILEAEQRVSVALFQRRLASPGGELCRYTVALEILRGLQRAGYVDEKPSVGWVNFHDVLKMP